MAEEIKADDALKNDDALSENNQDADGKTGDEPIGEAKEKDKKLSYDHRFESALGTISAFKGQVQSQESKLSSLDEKLDTILQTMAEPRIEPAREVDLTEDPDFMPTTMAELDKWANQRDTVRLKADRDYSNDYTVQIDGLAKGEESKEVHDAIVKEMMDNFNVRHSNDGVMDADLNYSKASRSYYKKQLEVKGKTNPLTGPDKNKPPLGGGLDGEEMKEKETAMPKLDADAQAFIKETGMNDESVKKALVGIEGK